MTPTPVDIILAVVAVGSLGVNMAQGRSSAMLGRRKARVDDASDKRDAQAADDALSDRIMKLADQVAEKRIQLVTMDFDLKMAQAKFEHAEELSAVRADFERQIAEVREDADRYHCEKAPACKTRKRREKPPAAPMLGVGGTD